MVDEDSSNSDEWAQYDTCTPASNSIDFTGTRICDGSFESKNCFYLNIDYSYARGCDYFCREFGFQGGEGTTERQKGKLGYADYASYKLESRMAKTPDKVFELLDKMWKPAINVAKNEAKDLQAIIEKEGGKFKLEAWDWMFYAEKLHKQKYDRVDFIRSYGKFK